MSVYLDTINKLLSLGVILLQAIIIFIFVNLIFFRKYSNKILIFLKKHTFHFGFIVALGSVLVSLFYSEIVGYPPCDLCWMQRIFVYPQFILFGMELYKKDKSIVDFSIVFAILGSILSIYHIFIESGGIKGIACTVINPSSIDQTSCAIRYVYEFSYMTIPVMALTSSLFILAILLNYKYIYRM